MNNKVRFLFLGIFLLAGAVRLFGLEWDQGHHMHPDERAITLFTEQLSLPTSLNQFLQANSPWNPQFFAYGSLPIYLLFWISFILSSFSTQLGSFDALTIIGRFLSAFADLGTLTMIFLLGRKLWSEKVGLLAASLYGISVLPIQLSHFYTVDTLLTFFLTTLLYLCILFYKSPRLKLSILIGTFLALALTTKISATVILISVGLALCGDFLFIISKRPHHFSHWKEHLPPFIKHLFIYGLTIVGVASLLFIIIEPYAVIDFKTFWQQTQDQAQMTRSAFTFPYTLQYVGKIPYLYELKQIFFVGLGPIITLLGLGSILWWSYQLLRKEKKEKWATEAILLIFFWVYVAIVGRFAIGFMRYMLPIYPLLILFAACLLTLILKRLFILCSKRTAIILTGVLFIIILIWPLSFLQIYTRPFSRFTASEWMHKNIPPGRSIAVEHWDDALPLFGQENYTMITLPLYEPDTPEKWINVNALLDQTDYIVLASNRLSTPLTKLTNCAKLPQNYCYPQTAKYYQELFDGTRGFTKVAEFTSFPTIPLIDLPINDQGFDESFSVYDHPKVVIFKKTLSQ